jgi:ubiquilin
MATQKITVTIKSSTGINLTVEADLSSTVAEFKVLLSEKTNIAAEQQRLIYSGHVLKDPQTLASYCKFHVLL